MSSYRIALPFAALAGLVLALAAWPLAWNAEYAAKERARLEADSVMQEISRVGRESLLSTDDLMLLSYIKNLRAQRPEIAYATVWKNGHIFRFGAGKDGTTYREIRASSTDAARSIVLGFDMKALERTPAGVPEAPEPWFLTGLGLCLMLVAAGAALAGREKRQRSQLPMPREAIVGEVIPAAIKNIPAIR